MTDLEVDENIVVEARVGNLALGLKLVQPGHSTAVAPDAPWRRAYSQELACFAARCYDGNPLQGGRNWDTVGDTDTFSIDNVNIAFSTTTVAADAALGYTTTFTEPGTSTAGTPVAIALNPVVADLNGPPVMGATVKLTNAQIGDALTIASALPAGITSSFGPAVAGVITMYLSGPASFAAMQTAIGLVRFSNTSQNPVAGDRIINVTVNDGETESAIATATVTVVASDDPTVQQRPIMTNTVLKLFVVPEWALLANDVDPDSP